MRCRKPAISRRTRSTGAFEPSRAALLIHDMQEYFLNFWGENSAMMEKVVANIAALRDFCKQNGIPVYYTASRKSRAMKTAPC
ncbi:isochorismatase [Klebsiella pneumoniae]|uniref:Isochorismatase n=1 Tax=Klebsiella pneumoniae TaxID=573 RepID=A0A2X3GNN1_KLEPN|nr:isochorismatase [Klebsiella pneumoniae]